MDNSICCYSYVEDAPSRALAIKLIEYVNRFAICKRIRFKPGFPEIKNGNGQIKTMAHKFIEMGKCGIWVLIITDLDRHESPNTLIQNWFDISCGKQLPLSTLFRVAVKEIESWIMADKEAFADFLSISPSNFTDNPDRQDNPKEFILAAIKAHGKKKWHRNMLPTKNSHIGPEYNERICEFINNHWSPERAKGRSPSLERTILRLMNLLK